MEPGIEAHAFTYTCTFFFANLIPVPVPVPVFSTKPVPVPVPVPVPANPYLYLYLLFWGSPYLYPYLTPSLTERLINAGISIHLNSLLWQGLDPSAIMVNRATKWQMVTWGHAVDMELRQTMLMCD